MKTRTIYGIYQGCKYEGGAVEEILYETKEEARKEALILVEKENKQLEQDKDDGFNSPLFEEVKEDLWDNDIDVIKVIEFKIKSKQ